MEFRVFVPRSARATEVSVTLRRSSMLSSNLMEAILIIRVKKYLRGYEVVMISIF